MSTAPHCLVVGVGPGLGMGCVRRFAADGYRVSMIARHAGRLESWEAEVEHSAGYPTDVADLDGFRHTLSRIVAEQGLPEVVIYNAARATFGNYRDISMADFETNFRINTAGLLVLAQELAPAMVERGSGSIMVTGNTGSLRGTPNFVGWSPTKAGQRILAESLARELGPRGIHVAYIVVDALIDMPFARRNNTDKPADFFAQPADLAETIFHTAHQPKTAWSFYVELRPFGESW